MMENNKCEVEFIGDFFWDDKFRVVYSARVAFCQFAILKNKKIFMGSIQEKTQILAFSIFFFF